MAGIFQKLAKLSGGDKQKVRRSVDWFRNKVADLSISGMNRRALLRDKELIIKKGEPMVGRMGVFFYDPKHKDTLPYYDRFPLVIIIGPAEGGFLGLNLHYLPPVLRAKFLDGLLDMTNNKRYDESTRFRATYEMLKKSSKTKYFAPCVKHYLDKHMRSQFNTINPNDWETVAFLPIADFKKASDRKVWADSRKAI